MTDERVSAPPCVSSGSLISKPSDDLSPTTRSVLLGLPERAGLLDAIALASERVNECIEREIKWAVIIENQFSGRYRERVVGICELAATEACEGEIWYALEAHARPRPCAPSSHAALKTSH